MKVKKGKHTQKDPPMAGGERKRQEEEPPRNTARKDVRSEFTTPLRKLGGMENSTIHFEQEESAMCLRRR